jgi:alkylated DNA nucleotide flippase Atl1
MQVRETSLQELIGGPKQFRVPLFQRTYTWRSIDHAQLWNDILNQYDDLVHADAAGAVPAVGGHFIGSFVLAPTASNAALPAFLVVDGQQRLTTLLLALCALREVAASSDPQAADRITKQFLINEYAENDDKWKFVPTEQDRKSFFACIEGHIPASSDLIVSAYHFFEQQLALPGPDEEPLNYRVVEQVIVSKLSIIDITAQHGDNIYRIFESLNATGVGLTQADLLRNYLFMLLPTRGNAVYKEVWLPMQESLGVENLEGLARVDLRRRGTDVREDEVYRTQQARLEPLAHDEAAIEAEICDLAVRANHYQKLLEPLSEPHPQIRRGLTFFQRWGANTAHPLVMFLYEKRDEGVIDDDQFGVALLNVESFLVRRLLVGVQSRNLNRIFIQLVIYLRQHPEEPILEAVRYQLSTERKYWASDDDVRTAARRRTFYQFGRALQRRMVLERLEESYGHKEQGELAVLQVSVEHIMPQSLSVEWAEMLKSSGEDPGQVHRELVHTLGNLTLSGYNSELSNIPFERKQQIYEASHLSLNKDLTNQGSWGRAEVEARADELAEMAISIWPGPVPGASEPGGTFDWSRVHVAIASIPDGCWTTYGDLAVLGGTSAQAVGNHIAALPSILKAYRVLTAEGKISEGFRWYSPSDTRDPQKVLGAEGITFSDDGRADPGRRASSDDLLSLVGQLDLEDLIEGETV